MIYVIAIWISVMIIIHTKKTEKYSPAMCWNHHQIGGRTTLSSITREQLSLIVSVILTLLKENPMVSQKRWRGTRLNHQKIRRVDQRQKGCLTPDRRTRAPEKSIVLHQKNIFLHQKERFPGTTRRDGGEERREELAELAQHQSLTQAMASLQKHEETRSQRLPHNNKQNFRKWFSNEELLNGHLQSLCVQMGLHGDQFSRFHETPTFNKFTIQNLESRSSTSQRFPPS